MGCGGTDRRSVMELAKMTVLADLPRTGEATDAIPTPVAGRASPIVLVVEHDPVVADTLTTPLRQAGFHTVLTSDALTALCQVRAGAVDLVLVDLDLPGPSGLDLCRQLSAAARDDEVHLPILALISAARREDVGASYAAGADDYVPTPCHPAELLARTCVRLQVRALERVALGPRAPLGPAGGPVHPSQQQDQAATQPGPWLTLLSTT